MWVVAVEALTGTSFERHPVGSDPDASTPYCSGPDEFTIHG